MPNPDSVANLMTHAELLALGVNGTLVLITGLYAFFTFRILRANQRVADEMALQRQDLLRPIISIGPEVDDYLVISLLIKNTGLSPATDVQLSLDADFYRFAEDTEANNLRTFGVFNTPISTFAAGAMLRFDLAQGFNLNTSKNSKLLTPMEFTIKATYKFLHHQYEEESHLDLSPYMNSTIRRSKYDDELEKIRLAVERIAASSSPD